MNRRSSYLIFVLLTLLGLAGCGQMGPLYLPGDTPGDPTGDPTGEEDADDDQDE